MALLLTYRGYSGNPGKPTEQGLYNDARAAMTFLQSEQIALKCIVLFGSSIGAAVAMQIATEYPVGALIMKAPFTSLPELGQAHYPFLPVKWLSKDRYNNIAKVNKIHLPVLVFHGENDRVVPLRFGKALFAKLSEPKQAVFFPERGHNDLLAPNTVIDFVQRNVRCGLQTTAVQY